MKLPRRQFLHLAAGAAALPAVSRVARAQAYPTRPIRLVIPFPPGGGFDAVGRPWAEKIKPLLGTIVVENQGGGGSSLGAAQNSCRCPIAEGGRRSVTPSADKSRWSHRR